MLGVVACTWLLASGATCCAAESTQAQDYPNRLIRIVSGEPGGGTGFTARVVAQGLTSVFGQQAIVENRGGASGAISVQTVAKAPPDGYTLLLNGSQVWMLPLLQPNVSYDPVADLAPIMYVARQPNILVVPPALPVRSVKELMVLAKARPGALNYAAGSLGSSTHLSAELFKTMADVDIVLVSYKGTGPALTALLGGQVELMFGISSAVMPHIRAEKLRALAITTAQPSDLAPGLPTVAAAGLPGYESEASHALFAPVRTPEPIIGKLNQEIRAYVTQSDVKGRLLQLGVEVVASSPKELAVLVESDIAKWGKLIRGSGIAGH